MSESEGVVVGWFGAGLNPTVWHLTRMPRETPTLTLCGELLGDPQVIDQNPSSGERCPRCIGAAEPTR